MYTLTANEVLPEDSGVWKCEISNRHGVSAATCTVRILDSGIADDEDADERLPRFVSTLENMVAPEDTDAVLICMTNPEENLEVTWYRNDLPVVGSNPGMERYYTFSEDGVQKLEIRRVRPRDVAVYKCKIANKIGWTSCDAKLSVKDPFECMDLVQYTRVHEYSLVDSIKGRKALDWGNRSWNDADLLISSFCETDIMKRFLIKWQNDDNGTLCFPIHLKSKCSVEGAPAVLSCLVKGRPPFDVRWYRNNAEVFDGFKYYLKNMQGILSLTIPNSEVTDTGHYQCEVRNRQGRIFTSCYLQVEPGLERSSEVPMKPMFVKPLKRLTVNEGELINFRVTAKGYPPPGFKWYKDGLEIHDSERIRTEILPGGVAELTISMATVRDIGLYTCEAHNLAGRAQSMVRVSVRDEFEQELWKGRDQDGVTIETEGKQESTIEFIERSKPKTYTPHVESQLFERVPEFKMHLPQALSIHSKQRFLLEVKCVGNPKPNVRWFKDGIEIFEGTRFRLLSVGDWYGLEVLSASPREIGTYTVKVTNESGTVESSCSVEMSLPVCNDKEFSISQETLNEFAAFVEILAGARSQLNCDVYDIAQIVPSFHLCNTEADWTTFIEKEIEVIDADEAPSFPHALPDKLTPHENDKNVHLECQVRGEPIPKIIWLKNDADLEQGPNITWSMDPKTRIASLVIHTATVADSGHYSCVAYSESGGHATTSTDVQVLPADIVDAALLDDAKKSVPEFKVKLSDRETTAGSEVKLECLAEGFPVPKVRWYKNDTPISPTIGKYTITSSVEGYHSLIIAGVHLSDSDCYKCEAANECGVECTTAHIVVQEPCEVTELENSPSFENPLHNLIVNSGDTATFKCVARGNPTPCLSWKKDDQDLTDNERVSITQEDGTGTLKITDIVAEDEGLYLCIAENLLGKVESCASIKINDTTDREDGPAGSTVKDVTPFTDALQEVSDHTHSDQTVSTETARTRKTPTKMIHEPEETTLKETLSEVLGSTQELGEVTSKTVESQPEEPLDLIDIDYSRRPRFILPPCSVWSPSGSAFKLEVVVTKSPDLTVSWYHNDQLVTGGRFKVEVQDGER